MDEIKAQFTEEEQELGAVLLRLSSSGFEKHAMRVMVVETGEVLMAAWLTRFVQSWSSLTTRHLFTVLVFSSVVRLRFSICTLGMLNEWQQHTIGANGRQAPHSPLQLPTILHR